MFSLAEAANRFNKHMILCKDSLKLKLKGVDPYPYKEVKKVGKGGQGSCFRVKKFGDIKTFIAKVEIKNELSGTTLMEWITISQHLKYEMIVTGTECFWDPEKKEITMILEDCANGDVNSQIVIKKRKKELFDEKEIVFLLYRVAAALRYSHIQKIYHCDIKPMNIFITHDGSLKLGDFGVSNDELYQDFTSKGECKNEVGTWNYMSPEMFEGKIWDGKTDIWSLGCVLYELCTL